MTVEEELNALRKLEPNKACMNCDVYNKFGHQNICEKYRTFVCSHCKSAHQSYSMRVKSISMSHWTVAEVDALKEVNGGGNAAGRRVWLAKWSEDQMRKPKESDALEYFKRFIDRVYNERVFYDESGVGSGITDRKSVCLEPKEEGKSTVDLLDFDAVAPAGKMQAGRNILDVFGETEVKETEWCAFASAPKSESCGGAGFDAFASSDIFQNQSQTQIRNQIPNMSQTQISSWNQNQSQNQIMWNQTQTQNPASRPCMANSFAIGQAQGTCTAAYSDLFSNPVPCPQPSMRSNTAWNHNVMYPQNSIAAVNKPHAHVAYTANTSSARNNCSYMDPFAACASNSKPAQVQRPSNDPFMGLGLPM